MTDVTSFPGSCVPAAGRGIIARNTSRRAARATFFLGTAALLFAASVAATIARHASMAAMGELPMPGGWMLSTLWTRMCGESWPRVAASFLGMWGVMMLAMMLPAVMRVLWRYRLRIDNAGGQAADRLTALVGTGYFLIWMAQGIAIFPLGAALAAVEMGEPGLARAVPLAAGVIVMLAGLVQFTAWKAHHLACCREAPGQDRAWPANASTALRHGLRVGLHCAACSAGLTTTLLVLGVMDLLTMMMVTAAVTAERLLPAGERVAQAIGAVTCAAGLLLIARAAGL
jgi:predicted metal-binding membrane protein